MVPNIDDAERTKVYEAFNQMTNGLHILFILFRRLEFFSLETYYDFYHMDTYNEIENGQPVDYFCGINQKASLPAPIAVQTYPSCIWSYCDDWAGGSCELMYFVTVKCADFKYLGSIVCEYMP